MNLTRFDPFRELDELATRVNKALGRPALSAAIDGFADWSPAIDVQETDAEYLIKADLPEVEKENVKVGIVDGILTLEGERRQEKEEKTKKFHRVERSYGRFERRLSVPSDVDPQKVAADFKNGVLSIHLPKAATAKPREIAVKVA